MRKILALLLVPFALQAQPSLWWGSNTITTDINGGTIAKNDTIVMEVKLNPNFSTIRSVFFDFQHQKDAITRKRMKQRQRFKPSRRGVSAQARDAKRLRVRRKPSRLRLSKDQPQLGGGW